MHSLRLALSIVVPAVALPSFIGHTPDLAHGVAGALGSAIWSGARFVTQMAARLLLISGLVSYPSHVNRGLVTNG